MVYSLFTDLYIEADVDEDVKNETLQAENQRLLALQQKTNQRLRELELSNEEKAGLLRAALLDRDNLTPELLELMRVELLQRVREQIERVVHATPETQPKVLESEATDIAKTVMESQAALDYAKKVSSPDYSQNDQYSTSQTPISPIRSKRDHVIPSSISLPMGTINGNASEPLLHNLAARNASFSAMSISSAGTEPTTLGKLSQISQVFRRRKRVSGVLSETLFSQPSFQVASFCTWCCWE